MPLNTHYIQSALHKHVYASDYDFPLGDRGFRIQCYQLIFFSVVLIL